MKFINHVSLAWLTRTVLIEHFEVKAKRAQVLNMLHIDSVGSLTLMVFTLHGCVLIVRSSATLSLRGGGASMQSM